MNHKRLLVSIAGLLVFAVLICGCTKSSPEAGPAVNAVRESPATHPAVATASASPTSRPREESPIQYPATFTFESSSPEKIAEAEKRGASSAEKDIKAGKRRILVYGGGGPPEDPETGYPTMAIPCCDMTGEVSAQTDAYNKVMRQWHEKHQ